MSTQPVTQDPQYIYNSASTTTVFGRNLYLVRVGWLAVLFLVVGLFFASLPYAVFDVKYYEWQVLQARPAAATIFPTYDDFVTYLLFFRMIAVIVFWGTALTIAWRKPNDWLVLYVSATLLMMSYLFAFQSDTDRWRFPRGLLNVVPAIEWAAPLLFIGCFFLLFYLFPDGRFKPRWIGLAAIGLTGSMLIFLTRYETILAIPEDLAWGLFLIGIMSFAFFGLISQSVKWRLASLVQKQQTRLVLLALVIFLLLPIMQSFFGFWFSDNPWLHFFSLHIFLVGVTLIPLAIGFSALRYRLWQMDVLLNRTLVYGTLTAVIVLLYTLVVGTLGVLFGSRGNIMLAVLATGLIALLFAPLRQRLQRSVNRLMYGQRNDPMTVVAELGRKLENTAVPGETLPALVQTIAQTLKFPYVAVQTNQGEVLAAAGEVSSNPLNNFPLIYQSQMIGELLVSQRSAREHFSPDEERLLRQIARQAGTAVYAFQLTNQLQRSRERLVTTRAEERRRLRRDLHDGLGPQLATLTIKVNAVQNLLHKDIDGAEALLAEVKTEAQRAIQEIRHVVEELQPALMDQLGLLSALKLFVVENNSGSTQISLQAPNEVMPLPAAVEVAIYRIVTEAVTNTCRHASAENCAVRLTEGEQLQLEIVDDGAGLPVPLVPGVGITSMRERAEEVGGTFQIESLPDRGTRLEVFLPHRLVP